MAAPGENRSKYGVSRKSDRSAIQAETAKSGAGGSLNSLNELLYKPPMNPYVVSSCLRASLRFPYATHVLAYAADSGHVKLTHRLRVGVLSVSPQELLTRAPFLMQPPELFKMTYSEEEDDENYLRVSASWCRCSSCKSRNGVCGSGIHLEGWRAAAPSERLRACLRACLGELTRPSPHSFPKPAVSGAFGCPKCCNST